MRWNYNRRGSHSRAESHHAKRQRQQRYRPEPKPSPESSPPPSPDPYPDAPKTLGNRNLAPNDLGVNSAIRIINRRAAHERGRRAGRRSAYGPLEDTELAASLGGRRFQNQLSEHHNPFKLTRDEKRVKKNKKRAEGFIEKVKQHLIDLQIDQNLDKPIPDGSIEFRAAGHFFPQLYPEHHRERHPNNPWIERVGSVHPSPFLLYW